MSLTNEELLQKATFTTADFGGPGQAQLKIQAAQEFIERMTVGQQLLPDIQTITHTGALWQQSLMWFPQRIMRPGVQATRLASSDQAKPTTEMIELSTVLIKGEIPVSDEVFEDNIEGDALAQTLEDLIADRAGYDLEELGINGDVTSADPYLALLDGYVKQMQGPEGHVVDATQVGQDYNLIFKRLFLSLPQYALRQIEQDGRFWVPKRVETLYRDILSQRGTPLGDISLTGNGALQYQGIPIVGLSNLPITTTGGRDSGSFFLTNRNNLYAGFRRHINLESFRDPREGATSFIITCRADFKVANPDASAIATNVDVTVS